MNDARRKKLDYANALIEQAQSIIEGVAEEELEAFNNLPEGLQESERGQQMEQNAEFLDEIVDTIDSCYCDIVAVIEGEVFA